MMPFTTSSENLEIFKTAIRVDADSNPVRIYLSIHQDWNSSQVSLSVINPDPQGAARRLLGKLPSLHLPLPPSPKEIIPIFKSLHASRQSIGLDHVSKITFQTIVSFYKEVEFIPEAKFFAVFSFSFYFFFFSF